MTDGRTAAGGPPAVDGDPAVPTGSLRRRVVLAVVALLLTVLTVLGITVHLLLGQRLQADLRQRLVDRASYAQVLTAQGVTGQTLVDHLAGQGITAEYRTATEDLLGREAPTPPTPPGPGALRPPKRAAAVPVQQSGDRYTVTVALTGGELTLGADSGDTHRTLALLDQIEVLAGLLTLVVTGLLLTRVVGAALSPLDRITALARQITTGTRGRRLRPTRADTDLGRTAAAFDAMLDALETAETAATTAEERMRRFLTDASHDLRTPIAGMLLSAETVLRDDPGRAERERRLVAVIREGHRAATLVEDLLRTARTTDPPDPAERAAPGGAPVDLGALAADVVDHQQALDPGVRWTLHRLAAPVPATGDPDELIRAVTNVVDNARHAAHPAGAVTVAVGTCPGRVLLDVTDTGPGIPPADRERIFDRLVRLDGTRGDYAGSGLGLPIARGILRGHGGDLTCLPTERGAHFRITLPAAPVPPAGHVAAASGATDSRVTRPTSAAVPAPPASRPPAAIPGSTPSLTG